MLLLNLDLCEKMAEDELQFEAKNMEKPIMLCRTIDAKRSFQTSLVHQCLLLLSSRVCASEFTTSVPRSPLHVTADKRHETQGFGKSSTRGKAGVFLLRDEHQSGTAGRELPRGRLMRAGFSTRCLNLLFC